MKCIVRLRTSFLMLILHIFFVQFSSFPYFEKRFFLSKIAVKPCKLCETVQARVVIFGKQVDNDVLYGGIANKPSHAYSFLYLSDFLSIC